MKVDFLITHGPGCADGFCCFWQIKKAFPDVEVLFANYGDPLPAESLYAAGRVLIADFSYGPADMAVIAAKAESVVCLDHHVSAVRKWDGVTPPPNSTLVFDVSKCGAMLVWEWLNPDGRDRPWNAPWLVRYVQDADLWAWELPESRAVNAYIRSFPKTIEAWDLLDAEFQAVGTGSAASIGNAILRTNEQYVAGVVGQATPWTVAGGVDVPVVNTTHLHSDVGERLSKGYPFSATYFDDLRAGVRQWSLRSQKGGGADVSKVAEGMGGGGHAGAAGFRTPIGTSFAEVSVRLREAYARAMADQTKGGE